MTASDPLTAARRLLAGLVTHAGDAHSEPPGHIYDMHVDAFVDLGVFSAAEAEHWRRRIALAQADDGRSLSELADPVREALEKRFNDFPPRMPAAGEQALQLGSALTAIQALRVLPQQDEQELTRRMAERLDYPEADPSPVDDEMIRQFEIWSDLEPGELTRVVPSQVV